MIILELAYSTPILPRTALHFKRLSILEELFKYRLLEDQALLLEAVHKFFTVAQSLDLSVPSGFC